MTTQTRSTPQLTATAKTAIAADLKRAYLHEGIFIALTEYQPGVSVEFSWMAGSYSSKGAWIDGRVVIDNHVAHGGGTHSACYDFTARTPRGAMRAIANKLAEATVITAEPDAEPTPAVQSLTPTEAELYADADAAGPTVVFGSALRVARAIEAKGHGRITSNPGRNYRGRIIPASSLAGSYFVTSNWSYNQATGCFDRAGQPAASPSRLTNKSIAAEVNRLGLNNAELTAVAIENVYFQLRESLGRTATPARAGLSYDRISAIKDLLDADDGDDGVCGCCDDDNVCGCGDDD